MLNQAHTTRPAGRDIVANMADFIIRQNAGSGSVTRDDLLLDFTEAEIEAHFPAAKLRARNTSKAARQ